METTLTIVLPVHNAEQQIRLNTLRVMEVAAELTPCFEVLLVDDGSTDDTFEVASEMATIYPQVSVLRSGSRRGLGGTLREVKRRAAGRVVIVHDGVSTINANDLRALYRGADSDVSVEDLRRPAQTHSAMVAAHDRLRGFQVLDTDDASDTHEVPRPKHRSADKPAVTGKSGVGQIPPVPRPNLFGAFGDFALGE